MTFFEHLSELRNRFLIIVLSIITTLISPFLIKFFNNKLEHQNKTAKLKREKKLWGIKKETKQLKLKEKRIKEKEKKIFQGKEKEKKERRNINEHKKEITKIKKVIKKKKKKKN